MSMREYQQIPFNIDWVDNNGFLSNAFNDPAAREKYVFSIGSQLISEGQFSALDKSMADRLPEKWGTLVEIYRRTLWTPAPNSVPKPLRFSISEGLITQELRVTRRPDGSISLAGGGSGAAINAVAYIRPWEIVVQAFDREWKDIDSPISKLATYNRYYLNNEKVWMIQGEVDKHTFTRSGFIVPSTMMYYSSSLSKVLKKYCEMGYDVANWAKAGTIQFKGPLSGPEWAARIQRIIDEVERAYRQNIDQYRIRGRWMDHTISRLFHMLMVYFEFHKERHSLGFGSPDSYLDFLQTLSAWITLFIGLDLDGRNDSDEVFAELEKLLVGHLFVDSQSKHSEETLDPTEALSNVAKQLTELTTTFNIEPETLRRLPASPMFIAYIHGHILPSWKKHWD